MLLLILLLLLLILLYYIKKRCSFLPEQTFADEYAICLCYLQYINLFLLSNLLGKHPEFYWRNQIQQGFLG